MSSPDVDPVPAPLERIVRLALDKIGSLRCGGIYGHDFLVLTGRGRMFLRCHCGAESEGFQVYEPLEGEGVDLVSRATVVDTWRPVRTSPFEEMPDVLETRRRV